MLKRLLLLALIILLPTTGLANTTNIRVKIADNKSSIDVYTNRLGKTTFRATGPAIEANGKRISQKKISLSGDGGLIWVNGKSYLGEIIIEQTSPLKLTAINTLPIEQYVAGTLAGEMPGSWPLEALKAQAVTARTYALYVTNEKRMKNSKSSFDIRSTIEDQVYKGGPNVNSKVVKAVGSTAGETLMYHNKPIKTRFHSTCGGKTETSIHVWGETDISKRINDPYCKNSPHNNWTATFTSNEISNRLRKHGFKPGNIELINIETHSESGRIAAASIHGSSQTISLTGNDFRRYLGFGKIKSTLFTISKKGSTFTFSGRGFGHGVGMCQWGANGMASKGHTYKDILNFYYPGTEIKKSY
jgi:stage II sporulation protein D